MKTILKKLIATSGFILLCIESFARSAKKHSFGERFFIALAGIVFLVGIGIYFFSEMNRKNGDYGSGLAASNAQQNRYGCFLIIIAPILIILFLLSKGCS